MNFSFAGALAVLRTRLRLRLPMLLLVSLVAAAGMPVHAAAANGNAYENSLETGVKAAFLYKFLGYIEWPPEAFQRADLPFVIGVTGADPIAAELGKIASGRTVNNRPVVVRRLTEKDALTGIHMLFIGRNAAARQAQLLEAAQKNSIVTVTETEDALAQGSVINFRLANGRVRFEVSLAAAEKSDLKLSSRMLSVASSVHGMRR